MMHKQTATVHKPMPEIASFGLMFHGAVAKLRNAVRIDIPVGYQDEMGFHMGVKPAKKGVQWPPVW
jgi:hypothetical protein